MDASPFSKLPAELRIKIYEFVLYSPDDTGECAYDHGRPKLPFWATENHRRSLTAVCLSMRTESFPMFYGFRKISFIPLVLDKYEPGFFHHNNREKVLMLWEYLGNPFSSFSAWLDHLGNEVRTKVREVEVCVGVWNVLWVAQGNKLIEWLTRNLAGLVRLFRESKTQVSLRFDFDCSNWLQKVKMNVSLPISDITTAYQVLEDTVDKEILASEMRSGGRYDYAVRKSKQHMNQCRALLREYLRVLERHVNDGDNDGADFA